ncbi:MAG TPA: hypothetical protein VE077_09595 [Candidatus Methylomirabilis sp.]|nr:hypothetical protein [Candidatus Methylomirabilis sp.]
MAIGLFLAEKTPLTVIFLLLLMLALSVYPILHFAKGIGARTGAFSLFAIGTLLFGWYAWPHNHSISANTQETRQSPQEPQQPKLEDKKDDKKVQDQKKSEAKPKPKAEQLNQGPTVGNITQGPCSNVQVGGSNNTATTNCVPPSRARSPQQLTGFTAALGKTKGMLRVVMASSADDVFPLSQQLCGAAKNANWGIACPMSRNSNMGTEAIADGLECYSDNWESSDAIALKEAMKSAQLSCKYISEAYNFGSGVTVGGTGGVTILIGSPSRN